MRLKDRPAKSIFLTKRRKSGNSSTWLSSVKKSRGIDMVPGLRKHDQPQTRLERHTNSAPTHIQQELPPQPGRQVPESPCSRDDALGLQTKLQTAMETRKGATNPEFGKDLQAGGVAVQEAGDVMLQECDTGSSHVQVVVQAF